MSAMNMDLIHLQNVHGVDFLIDPIEFFQRKTLDGSRRASEPPADQPLMGASLPAPAASLGTQKVGHA